MLPLCWRNSANHRKFCISPKGFLQQECQLGVSVGDVPLFACLGDFHQNINQVSANPTSIKQVFYNQVILTNTYFHMQPNEMTYPSCESERLILPASFKRCPAAPVDVCLSDPARSTKFIRLILKQLRPSVLYEIGNFNIW